MTIDFTSAELTLFSPRMQAGYKNALLAGKETLRKYGILDNGHRLSHFMGQFGGETAGGTVGRENLNYTSVASIRNSWRARASKYSDAWISANLVRNPVAIGTWAYGDRMGNRPGTTDGFDFRGGGFLQTTGRYNVEKYCKLCGLDVRPDILDDHAATLTFACAEWKDSGCNELADANDLLGISKAINTGSAKSNVYPNGMNHREQWLAKARSIWWDVEPGAQAQALVSDKEVHKEVHADLTQSSWAYSLVGRGVQALRWIAPTGAAGAVGKKVLEGGNEALTPTVTPQATDLLGQVAAASNLIMHYGIPVLLIALLFVLALEGIRWLQRTYTIGAKP